MSLLSLPDFQRYCLAIAGRAGLRLQWIHMDEVPHTDGRTFYIPTPPTNPTNEHLRRAKTSITHEVDHCLYTDVDAPVRHDISMTGLYGALWNIFEDGRIEDLSGAEYAGDKELFDQHDNIMMQKLVDGGGNPMMYHKSIFTAWTLYIKHKAKNNPALSAVADQAERMAATIPECQPTLDKLLKSGILGRYADACSTADPVKGTEMTRKLAEELYDELSEEEKKKNPKEGSGGKAGDKGDKEDKGKGTGKKVGKGEEDNDGDTELDWSEVLKSKPIAPTKGATGEGKRRINYDCMNDSFSPVPLKDYKIKQHNHQDNYITNEAISLVKGAAGFTNRVRTQLQIATRSRWRFGQKTGHLHKGSLYKMTIPDAGSYGERVFKKKEVHDELDIAVCVVVDMSGSMRCGGKVTHALASAGILSDAIGNALHIPLEIFGFTESVVPIIYPMRSFSERNVGSDEVIRRVGGYVYDMMDNTDGEAILYAYDKIRQRKEKRKLIITLSDGYPAGGGERGDIAGFTRTVVKEIEKAPVEIAAIGIMDDSVKHFYKDHVVLQDAGKLEEALLSVVKSKIIGS